METPEKNVLNDCGMFQGLKDLRQLNWADFPYLPESIDVVLLTHGYLDHWGYLSRLVTQGFSGPILGTAPSLAIAAVILKDKAKIQKEEAERANREGYSQHTLPCLFSILNRPKKHIII